MRRDERSKCVWGFCGATRDRNKRLGMCRKGTIMDNPSFSEIRKHPQIKEWYGICLKSALISGQLDLSKFNLFSEVIKLLNEWKCVRQLTMTIKSTFRWKTAAHWFRWTEKLKQAKCVCRMDRKIESREVLMPFVNQAGQEESPRPVLEDWVVRFRRQVVSGTRDSVVFCGFDVSVLGVSALPNYNHGYQVDTRWIPGGYQVDTTDVPFKTGTNSAGRSAQGRRRQILLRILRNVLDDQLKGDMPTHILDILAWWGT